MTVSAGMLLFRESGGRIEVLLAHPGGPFWVGKDEGAWTIPKGALGEGEEPLTAARREFEEEMGPVPAGAAVGLDPVKQPGGKLVHAFAMRGDFDASHVKSNTFMLEWPPRSGRIRSYPEIDRAGWFPLEEARRKILRGQTPFLSQLEELLEVS
jgi:predicted NUDIX family NTP pyrophosphohydrolase